MRRVLLAAALAVIGGGCGGASSRPTLSVEPRSSVEDQPLAIEATGFPPHSRLTVTLRSIDALHVRFAAHVTVRADRRGRVDLGRATLLSAMAAAHDPGTTYYYWGSGAQTFRLTAAVDGHVRASTTFTRRWSATRYTERRLTVAKDGIDGTYFAPLGVRRGPAVLAFGGSEGGDNGTFAGGRFAAHGVPTLFIGYFHAPGVPDRLVNIPLEYFHRALLWLDSRPQVDPRRVSIVTASYGTEAALLLGVDYPGAVHGIVAGVPSSVVTCGILGARRAGGGCLGSPWTFKGRPVPYTRVFDEPHPIDDPRAVIPVERIRARLLLACAGRDQVWSSCDYARAIVARRLRARERTSLYVYPRADHFVADASVAFEPGVRAEDLQIPWTERGREDLWPRVLAFVHR